MFGGQGSLISGPRINLFIPFEVRAVPFMDSFNMTCILSVGQRKQWNCYPMTSRTYLHVTTLFPSTYGYGDSSLGRLKGVVF